MCGKCLREGGEHYDFTAKPKRKRRGAPAIMSAYVPTAEDLLLEGSYTEPQILDSAAGFGTEPIIPASSIEGAETVLILPPTFDTHALAMQEEEVEHKVAASSACADAIVDEQKSEVEREYGKLAAENDVQTEHNEPTCHTAGLVDEGITSSAAPEAHDADVVESEGDQPTLTTATQHTLEPEEESALNIVVVAHIEPAVIHSGMVTQRGNLQQLGVSLVHYALGIVDGAVTAISLQVHSMWTILWSRWK